MGKPIIERTNIVDERIRDSETDRQFTRIRIQRR